MHADASGETTGTPSSDFDTSAVRVVLVTYEPELERLRSVLAALLIETCPIVLVDNGSSDHVGLRALVEEMDHGNRMHTVWNTKNAGLATAQNQGTAVAQTCNAFYVLLLDQDTVLPPGTVSTLLRVSEALTGQGRRIAAVGPAYRDRSSGARSLVWHHEGLRLKRSTATEQLVASGATHEIARSDFVIASGSLIALDVIKAVGGMEEALFIDLVDIEWGLRAQSRGYVSYQLRSLEADHAIGLGRIRVGPFSAPLHSPVRNYYWLRNALTLARRGGLPNAWRLYFVRRAMSYLAFYVLFGNARGARARHLLKGLKDGLRGISR